MRGHDRCFQCHYWMPFLIDNTEGFCERYPPQVYSIDRAQHGSSHPSTFHHDWCGEFKQSTSLATDRFPVDPSAPGENAPGADAPEPTKADDN